MDSTAAPKKDRRTKICASAKMGIAHIPISLRQLDYLGALGPRDSQLCVPASQQVCLYRCNRESEKSEVLITNRHLLRPVSICFVKINFVGECLGVSVPLWLFLLSILNHRGTETERRVQKGTFSGH